MSAAEIEDLIKEIIQPGGFQRASFDDLYRVVRAARPGRAWRCVRIAESRCEPVRDSLAPDGTPRTLALSGRIRLVPSRRADI